MKRSEREISLTAQLVSTHISGWTLYGSKIRKAFVELLNGQLIFMLGNMNFLAAECIKK
jgi:hypothetical protein